MVSKEKKKELEKDFNEKLRRELEETYERFCEEHGVKQVARCFSLIMREVEKQLKEHPFLETLKDREQSWKARRGGMLEWLVQKHIGDWVSQTLGLRCAKFTRGCLGKNYDKVKEQVQVCIGGKSVVPDVDLVVFQEEPFRVLAVLSVKKKFRECIAQVAYWTVKLRTSSSGKVKNFMVTTDENGTFDAVKKQKGKEKKEADKAIAIAQEDINGTFVAADRQIMRSEKIRPYETILDELRRLMDENDVGESEDAEE